MGYNGRSSWRPVLFTCVTFEVHAMIRYVPWIRSLSNLRMLLVVDVADNVGRELSYEGEDDVERKLGHYSWLRASLVYLVSREQSSNDEAENARTTLHKQLQQ